MLFHIVHKHLKMEDIFLKIYQLAEFHEPTSTTFKQTFCECKLVLLTVEVKITTAKSFVMARY